MPLTPGARFGAYEIVSWLGAGGVGEVFRARDTKLNRDVAIKALLPAVADDPERMARLSREAQVLAALNHPQIAQVYGLEESGDVRGLIMKFVEGETLAERMTGTGLGENRAPRPVPVSDALALARQIVDALEFRSKLPHSEILITAHDHAQAAEHDACRAERRTLNPEP